MQFCNYTSGLAIGLELLSGLAADERTREGHTAAQADGTGFDLVGREGFLGLPHVLTRGGDRVEHDQNGLAGGAQEGERVDDRRPAGDQNQVGRPGGCGRRAVRMRHGVDVEHLAYGLANAADFVRQAPGVSRKHDRLLGFAAVGPVGGGGLGIEVDHGGVASATAEATARCRARVVFPEPPFWLTMAMVFMRGL